MARHCDFCDTPLRGRGHGFITRSGKVTCGRSETQRTALNGRGDRALVKTQLPCAREK